VLDPSGLREDLIEFTLRNSANGSRLIEQQGTRAGGALVER
jgi:hypothetical protein